MDQKIAWYKEILELEPSSKIFFPLARLLLRDGLRDHAIDVLRQGLCHHKDFFEARLMLIELLHDAGDTAACDAEVRILLAFFTDYPQFWNAWGSCLAHDGAQNDVSLAMRFIAASQQCSDISFASLLDKGLQSFEKKSDHVAVETPILQDKEPLPFGVVASPPTFFDLDSLHFDNAPQTVEVVQPMDYADFLLQGNQEPMSQFAKNGNLAEEHDVAEDSDIVDDNVAMLLADGDSNDRDGILLQNGVAVMQCKTSFFETESAKNDASEQLYSPVVSYLVDEQQDTAVEELSEKLPEGVSGELFTLRTRSMAEVLLAQGDVQGALSIYDELRKSETEETAQLEIQERIDALRQNKTCLESVEALDEPCHGKEKLLHMLTLLAERLETRAQ